MSFTHLAIPATKPKHNMSRLFTRLLTLALFLAAGSVAAQSADIVTVGTSSGTPGATVDIPIYVRDTSGSPLGIDQPSGSRIQGYSIKVNYSPAASVQSVTFARAGITASLTPTFESSPSAPGSISGVAVFQESTNLIPFVSNALAPGNQIGVLHFTLHPSAMPGSVTLTLDSTLTQLTNEAGTTNEAVTTANLTLINGSITVTNAPVELQSFDVE